MTTSRSIQTLLFTDIVDSTVRAAELGDRAWRAILTEHDRLVRAQFRRFGGREVKQLGDGFLAVFRDPSGALRAAWEACRALEEKGLQIRAGIHTGAVESEGDDVAGIAVHIAARIQALAEPGQVLVSHVTRALEAGSGFGFEDLGERELKGVPESWRVFALTRVPEETIPVPAPPEQASLHNRRIAVLPFRTIGGDGTADIFSAGLHDDLLTQLSKISSLTVIGRTSVTGYRDTRKPTSEIGQELGVGTVVEGAVQHASGRIRLNVELVDAGSGVQQWAESYDRLLTTENIFDIQADLARKIAETVEVEFTSEERRRVGGEATADIEAYGLYVRGRNNVDQRSGHGLRRALEYFRRVIEVDPGYALAWAGIADAVNLLEWYGHGAPPGSPDPAFAARRAVELDPESGEAHSSLGILHALQRRGKEAIESLTEGVRLAPSYAEGHVWLGWVLLVAGRLEEALEALRRSLELDPLAPAVRVFLAAGLLAGGSVREALGHLDRALELEPGYGLGHHLRGVVLHHLGDHREALDALERSRSLVHPNAETPSRAEMLASRALAVQGLGDETEVRDIVAMLKEEGEPFWHGLVEASRGREPEAWRRLAAVREWDSFAPETLRYFYPRVLGPLREDPRFEEVISGMELAWGFR